MGIQFASRSFVILPLLLVMCAHHGNGARDPNVLRLHSTDRNEEIKGDFDVHKGHVHDHHHHHHDPSSSMDHHHDPSSSMDHHHHHHDHMMMMDPSTLVFFTLKDLKVGNKMPIYFRKRNPSSSSPPPQLLSREEADSIPFSSKQLPHLLQFFSLKQDSPQAKAMEDTLRQCESQPIIGETKLCPTSLESMLDFTRGVFGLDYPNFKVLTTTHLDKKSTVLVQNYTILEVPREILAPKMVACHTMPYPYAVFYCHSQESENKVFKVVLEGENDGKERVEAVAVCHMDTSQWSRGHVSFRVLGIEPGSSNVCHFFPSDNFVWVPTMDALN